MPHAARLRDRALAWPRAGVVEVPLRTWQPASKELHARPGTHPDEGPSLTLGGAVGRSLVDPPPALVEDLRVLFQRCEAGRYAGAGFGASDTPLAQSALDIAGRLERELG